MDLSRHQEKYTVEILKRFRMMDCKAMPTPNGDKSEVVEQYIFRDSGCHHV
jgi:hypothetical protein